MIYLDNSATTFPKPSRTVAAVQTAFRRYGANPGRSGHAMSMAAEEEMYRCRKTAAEFFGAPGPECVAFTLNCTQALNMVLKGKLHPGDHVVTSCLEHNAVMRPLKALESQGVSWTAAQVVPHDNDATLDAFRKALRPNTKLVVCTHASNVWGIRLPIERIAALCGEYGVPVAVDCAQSAGILPIDMEKYGFSYLCIAGHKGLYGPMGTGMLIARDGEGLSTILEGGTGTGSASFEQPESMPDRMESGTPNVPGIAGLRAGMQFVTSKGINRIFHHEMNLIQRLYGRLEKTPNILLYTQRPDDQYDVPVLSFNVEGMPSETVGRALNERGFAVRAGLHCAPAAHMFYGTIETGAVRVSPSVFSNMNEIEGFVLALMKIIRK